MTRARRQLFPPKSMCAFLKQTGRGTRHHLHFDPTPAQDPQVTSNTILRRSKRLKSTADPNGVAPSTPTTNDSVPPHSPPSYSCIQCVRCHTTMNSFVISAAKSDRVSSCGSWYIIDNNRNPICGACSYLLSPIPGDSRPSTFAVGSAPSP